MIAMQEPLKYSKHVLSQHRHTPYVKRGKPPVSEVLLLRFPYFVAIATKARHPCLH